MASKKKIKLVFFDMDGTLYKRTLQEHNTSSPWMLLAKNLGEKALKERKITSKKWNQGKYSNYMAWMEDNIRIYKKYGINKDLFEKTIDAIHYHKKIKELFTYLQKKGYKTAIISGGFKALADRALIDLKIDHAFAACEFYWDKKGNLLHYNLLPCDFEGKLDFMKLIIKEHRLKKEECAFVGDGANDIPFAKEVGLSIAFNGSEKLKKVSTYSINQEKGKEDLSVIKNYF